MTFEVESDQSFKMILEPGEEIYVPPHHEIGLSCVDMDGDCIKVRLKINILLLE